MLHWIKESFDNVIANIASCVDSIKSGFNKLFEYLDDIKGLLDGKKEDYNDFELGRVDQNDDGASGTINGAVNNVKGGFGFFNDITNSVNGMISAITDTSSAPSFSVYIDCWAYTGELKIIDLTWYDKFKPTGDAIICIFCYSAFLWHIFTRLPDIIQGGGAASYTGNMIEEISDYKRFGDFGYTRSSSFNSSWKGR